MTRLVIELSFTKLGRPIWQSIRVVERKVVKRNLKARTVARELALQKTRRARVRRGVLAEE